MISPGSVCGIWGIYMSRKHESIKKGQLKLIVMIFPKTINPEFTRTLLSVAAGMNSRNALYCSIPQRKCNLRHPRRQIHLGIGVEATTYTPFKFLPDIRKNQ